MKVFGSGRVHYCARKTCGNLATLQVEVRFKDSTGRVLGRAELPACADCAPDMTKDKLFQGRLYKLLNEHLGIVDEKKTEVVTIPLGGN